MPPKDQKDDIPSPSLPSSSLKRSLAPKSTSSPAKKQTKWTHEEDTLIIELRGKGEKWEDISKQLPGRSAISCRLHYQNYLERRSEWDEDKKNRLARLYERYVLYSVAPPWQRMLGATSWRPSSNIYYVEIQVLTTNALFTLKI